MKKSVLSFWFIAASAAYVAYLYFTGPQDVVAPGRSITAQQENSRIPSAAPGISEAMVSQPAPLPTPPPQAPKPAGMYADGMWTGSIADAYYGLVQVQATVQNGKLTGVQFLRYPNDRGTSRSINSQAMPMLESEAIQAQNANVDIISGATDTSWAFRQSLADALAQAKN